MDPDESDFLPDIPYTPCSSLKPTFKPPVKSKIQVNLKPPKNESKSQSNFFEMAQNRYLKKICAQKYWEAKAKEVSVTVKQKDILPAPNSSDLASQEMLPKSGNMSLESLKPLNVKIRTSKCCDCCNKNFKTRKMFLIHCQDFHNVRFKNKSGETVVLSNNTDSGQSKNCSDSFIKDKPEVVAEVDNSTEAARIVKHCKTTNKITECIKDSKVPGVKKSSNLKQWEDALKNEVKEANKGVEEEVLAILVPTKEAGSRKLKVQTKEMERDRSPDPWESYDDSDLDPDFVLKESAEESDTESGEDSESLKESSEDSEDSEESIESKKRHSRVRDDRVKVKGIISQGCVQPSLPTPLVSKASLCNPWDISGQESERQVAKEQMQVNTGVTKSAKVSPSQLISGASIAQERGEWLDAEDHMVGDVGNVGDRGDRMDLLVTELRENILPSTAENSTEPPNKSSSNQKCSKCGKVFTNLGNLVNHLKACQLTYVCLKCGIKFLKLKYLKTHVRLQHVGAKFPCTSCDLKFKSKSKVKSHVKKNHTDTQISCSVCNEKFKNASVLKTHKWKRHNLNKVVKDTMKVWPCTVCSKVFKSDRGLRAHKAMHKKLNSIQIAGLSTYGEVEVVDTTLAEEQVMEIESSNIVHCEVVEL